MENIFQSREWEELKLKTGYSKSYRVDGILVLQKNLPLGFSMFYSPMVDKNQVSRAKSREFMEQIKEIGKQNKTIFYRLELDIPYSLSLIPRSYIKSFEEMQPEHTLVLDITKSEEEILAQMKQKGRYNIRVAERNNVTVEKTVKPGAELDIFFDLYCSTGKRHGITYRAKEYFSSLLEILGESGYASLYTAYRDEAKKTPLASALIIYSGEKAIYLFGASSDEFKNLMAPYKLHFEIIKQAKAAGYRYYDFFGIAPEEMPNHPWAGVTRFKKQFGGEEVKISGSHDLVFKPLMYQLFKFAEKIRR